MECDILSTKTVKSIRATSLIAKTKNLTKSDPCKKILELDLMCWEHFCQRKRADSCRKIFMAL